MGENLAFEMEPAESYNGQSDAYSPTGPYPKGSMQRERSATVPSGIVPSGKMNDYINIEDVPPEVSAPNYEPTTTSGSYPSSAAHPRFLISKADTIPTNLSDQANGSESDLNESTIDQEDVLSELNHLEIKKPEPRQVQFSTDDSQMTHSHHNTAQMTQTIGYRTHDPVPMSVYYRNQDSLENAAKTRPMRPTLEQLHKGDRGLDESKKRHWDVGHDDVEKADVTIKDLKQQPQATKLGWIKGVLFPTLLNIWGVILFIRMPWIVGQAGFLLASVIVLLATVVTTVTALSMSAVCTNGEVKGGGAYYLISRSLGPEFGGSIGVIFSIANAVAVALYLVGFGETVQALMAESGVEMVSALNDVRIIGIIALVFLFIVTQIGLSWVIYTQVFMLVLLVAAIVSVIVGTFYPSPQESREVAKSFGLGGYTFGTFKENFKPDYTAGEGFFSVFAIFFPAATGIMAGSNLSGDLKEPSMAVPKGTLLAILISTIVYVGLCWFLGGSVAREASGIVAVYINGSLSNANSTCTADCKYGSIHDLQIMEKISLWGPLVTAGIFAATLSSALASLVSAPKVFQAVCVDKVFPHIDIFGKGYGKDGEPRWGYVLTIIIAAAFIAIGELNIIAPIISNFFLMAYALVNYAVFASSLSKSPGWRPSFKYYNMWVSLLGCLICIAIMFMINWWAALITIVVIAILYKVVDYRKPEINWGSSGQAHTYIKALRLCRQLNNVDEHVKNFRVQCLALTGQPSLRPNLIHFASHITKHWGLLVCGEVVQSDADHLSPLKNVESTPESKWLKKSKIKAFHQIVQSKSVREGVRSMMQSTGLGKLRPNTLLVGYMNRWQVTSTKEVNDYFHILHDAFDLNMGVAILRLQDGFDITEETEDMMNESYYENREPDPFTDEWDDERRRNQEGGSEGSQTSENKEEYVANPTTTRDIVLKFDKSLKGSIDVWWLYDDGGLTILMPHLLSLSSHWKGSKMQIFTPASEKTLKSNQVRMANLLKKFRIDYSSVVPFTGINKPPKEESIRNFKKYRSGEHLPPDGILDKKTLRQIRLGELLQTHSSGAKLIVLTLPIPKKNVVSPLMYMSWLEVLSEHLPPVLLVRGNQQSVLTFYS